jgi:hypothetical protein
VSDDSGGVLPGVTVSVSAADGHAARTTVTDASGEYSVDALPVGRATITFGLAGFNTAVVQLAVRPNAETWVSARLDLAALNETVVVSAAAPVDTPAPAPPPPVLIPVPSHDRASVCGPAKPGAKPEALGTIRSLRDDGQRTMYEKNDQLIIDGGTLNGLTVGRNLVVRRPYRLAGAVGAHAIGEHTSGLLQIVTASEHVSVGVVVYACDEVMKGDYLAAFTPELVRAPDAAGIPIFENASRILFTDAGQILGSPGRLMVIDRGESEGIRAGQRLTLFHPEGVKTSVVGDAVVVAVRLDSATIRVEHVTGVVEPGDWAAPQRPQVSRRE